MLSLRIAVFAHECLACLVTRASGTDGQLASVRVDLEYSAWACVGQGVSRDSPWYCGGRSSFSRLRGPSMQSRVVGLSWRIICVPPTAASRAQ